MGWDLIAVDTSMSTSAWWTRCNHHKIGTLWVIKCCAQMTKSKTRIARTSSSHLGCCVQFNSLQPWVCASIAAPTARNGSIRANKRSINVSSKTIAQFASQRHVRFWVRTQRGHKASKHASTSNNPTKISNRICTSCSNGWSSALQSNIHQNFDLVFRGLSENATQFLLTTQDNQCRATWNFSKYSDFKIFVCTPIHLHKSHGVVISWISCAKGVDHTLLPFAGSTPSRRVINKDSFAVRQRLAYSLQNQQLTPSRAIRLLKINSRKMYAIHRVLQIYKGRPTGLEDISAWHRVPMLYWRGGIKIKHHAHSNKRDTKDRLGLFSKDTQFLCPRPRIRVETPRQNKL